VAGFGPLPLVLMLELIDRIDRTNRAIGRGAAWLALAIVILQITVVLGRYVFGLGSIKLQEAIVYLHATLFMLAAAYTLAVDGHVRVDIFYRDASPPRRAFVDLFGAVFFLIPVAVLTIVVAWPYVAQSWAVLERSREASGLPAVFLLKTLIPVFAIQVGLQGVVVAVRSAQVLRQGTGKPPPARPVAGL